MFPCLGGLKGWILTMDACISSKKNLSMQKTIYEGRSDISNRYNFVYDFDT